MGEDQAVRRRYQFWWDGFAATVRATAEGENRSLRAIARDLGLSHGTVHRASQGKVVDAEAVISLCIWAQQDPAWYVKDTQS